MANRLEYIRFLVTKEILGNLTEQEKDELLDEVAIDQDAKDMRAQMLQIASTREFVNYLQASSLVDTADILIKNIRNRRRKRIIYISSIASAAAIIVLLTISGIIKHPASEISNHQVAINENILGTTNKIIQLKLPNGKVINLNNDTNQVVAGQIQLKTVNKTLTYFGNSDASNGYATLYVPPGKDYKIQLTDGSFVQLNSASSIRFPLSFTGNLREIFISGEAYVKVTPNVMKPFIVHLPNEIIQVLGTEFNVNTYDSKKTIISLVEGKVRLIGKHDSLELQPGEEGVFLLDNILKRDFDEYETLGWRIGQFYFNNARLQEVCDVIPRWFGVNIVIDNKEVLNKQFSGKIDRNYPLENLLKGLQSTSAIDYYLDKDGVFHIK